jgi:hypothetical protein
MNLKNEINKKNKEFHNLKIAYFKLDEENKKNVKIVDEIIQSYGRNTKTVDLNKMKSDDYENEIKNILSMGIPSEKTLLRLNEVD